MKRVVLDSRVAQAQLTSLMAATMDSEVYQEEVVAEEFQV